MTFTFIPGPHHLTQATTIGLIPNWSHSALTKFETCAYAEYIRRVDKIKQPSGDAGKRGNDIHTAIEQYIRGVRATLGNDGGKKPCMQFLNELQWAYADGKVEVEQEWCFNHDWEVVEPRTPEVWAIFKLDAFHREDPRSARIIDHKSGKSWGNEVKHGEQGMFYGIAALMRYPELEYATTEFHYCDEGVVLNKSVWRREDLQIYLPRLTKRANAYTSATQFPPNPSKHNCRWCRYKDEVKRPDGTAACEWGVL